MVLEIFFQCSWSMEWVNAHSHGDKSTEEQAFNYMTGTVPEHISDPAARDGYVGMTNSAALGAVKPVRSIITGEL